MFTEEQSKQLTDQCIRLMAHTQNVEDEIAEVKEKLLANTEILRQSTEDIHVLLAFIKSKGLQPPKIQSEFIN